MTILISQIRGLSTSCILSPNSFAAAAILISCTYSNESLELLWGSLLSDINLKPSNLEIMSSGHTLRVCSNLRRLPCCDVMMTKIMIPMEMLRYNIIIFPWRRPANTVSSLEFVSIEVFSGNKSTNPLV